VSESANSADAIGETAVSTSAAPRPATGHGLTPREVEVVRLLAAGLSHREMAEALVVSVRTVGRHVDNIYGKLGLHDRRRVRQWVRDHGLLTDGRATR
jgi:DNA-binding NarL/FixJ family response regulator